MKHSILFRWVHFQKIYRTYGGGLYFLERWLQISLPPGYHGGGCEHMRSEGEGDQTMMIQVNSENRV